MIRLNRSLHKYFGLLTAIVVIIVAVTGVLLVHKKALGLNKVAFTLPGYAAPAAIDASDLAVAPDGATLAATKQGLYRRGGSGWELALASPTRQIVPQDALLYAAARDGLFASGDGGRNWRPVLERGEVKALLAADDGLTAATVSGIYRQAAGATEWQTLIAFEATPIDVRKMLPAAGGVLVAAKEGAFVLAGGRLRPEPLPAAAAAQKVDLQKIITDLHTGDFFGRWFYLAVDATGIGLVLLSLTGVYLWWWPRQKRRAALVKMKPGT